MTFSKRVYAAVATIPKGKVATYSQIALLAGSPNACRAVGTALHRNPQFVVIPCHRVVNAKGHLACDFAFGGREIQKQLLMQEEVFVNDEYIVDLSVFSIDLSKLTC